MARATARMAASPAAWPKVSLTGLSASRSTTATQPDAAPGRAVALDHRVERVAVEGGGQGVDPGHGLELLPRRAELLVGELEVAVLALHDDDQGAEAEERLQEEVEERGVARVRGGAGWSRSTADQDSTGT